MIRAYLDAGLRYPVSRDGSWRQPVELVFAAGRGTKARVWLHNNADEAVTLVRQPLAEQALVFTLPAVVHCPPGKTLIEVEVAGSNDTLPFTRDVVAKYAQESVTRAAGGYSDSDYSETGFSGTFQSSGGELVRFEVTAFALPAGDERFGRDVRSHIESAERLRAYVASGMGTVSQERVDTDVAFMSEMLHPFALWAVNKHHLLNPAFGPLRLARNRAISIGYTPPGVEQLPPANRRRAYANAFEAVRNLGSKRGLLLALETIGLAVDGNAKNISIEKDALNFTWRVQVPASVAEAFSVEYLQDYLQYHVDAYSLVDVSITVPEASEEYAELQFTPPVFGAPQNVAAARSGEDAVITWEAANRAVNYRVMRSSTAGGPYEEIAQTTGLTHTDAAVGPEARYYVIVAENKSGTLSGFSLEGVLAGIGNIITVNGEPITINGEDLTE